jgi:uncharacterized membrane protein (DUF485 family)
MTTDQSSCNDGLANQDIDPQGNREGGGEKTMDKDTNVDSTNELQELINERNNLHTKIWRMMLGILIVFGLPAAIAVIVGKYLESVYGTNLYLFILLGIAFVFSWIIVITYMMKVDKKLRALDKRIKELREEEQSKEIVKRNN